MAATAQPQQSTGTRVLRYREALNEALREEMLRDESVMLMGEDIGVFNGAFKVTAGLLEEFGEKRVRDTPISENTIVGMGVGAAMTGLRPVVELMTINFSLLAFDQIVNHAAHIRYMFGGQVSVPLVVRMPQGAGHQLGPTHSHCFEALFLHVPGLLVAVPSTPADAKGLLKAAIRDDNPVVFIEHEYLYGQRGEVPEDDEHLVNFGEAAIRREGSDVTIVGISRMADDRSEGGQDPLRGARHRGRGHRPAHAAPAGPRHHPGLVRKTNRCVIVEEGWPHGGVGANIAALVQEQAFDDLDAPGRARHRRRRADALREEPRADRLPARAAGRRRGARDLPRPLAESVQPSAAALNSEPGKPMTTVCPAHRAPTLPSFGG
jgi:pyruvate dehydrogenase E1 component beta subunit